MQLSGHHVLKFLAYCCFFIDFCTETADVEVTVLDTVLDSDPGTDPEPD